MLELTRRQIGEVDSRIGIGFLPVTTDGSVEKRPSVAACRVARFRL